MSNGTDFKNWNFRVLAIGHHLGIIIMAILTGVHRMSSFIWLP